MRCVNRCRQVWLAQTSRWLLLPREAWGALGLPSRLWELAFLSVTVLRPHLAKDFTAEPNGINSFGEGRGGQNSCIRSWMVATNSKGFPCCLHLEHLPFSCKEGIQTEGALAACS